MVAVVARQQSKPKQTKAIHCDDFIGQNTTPIRMHTRQTSRSSVQSTSKPFLQLMTPAGSTGISQWLICFVITAGTTMNYDS